MAATPSVRVRMYRQGLGDCFLITFDPGGQEKHLLIDCGTLGATTTKVNLSTVVQDIVQTTGNRVHLLIATHEHWDHVRGFHDQKAAFTSLHADNVWLAWTENPNDSLAKKIVKKKGDLGAALQRAALALERSPHEESQKEGLAVRDVVGFFGDEPLAAERFSETVNEAMNFVRTKNATCRFCKPGDGPFEESWLPGFRFYVLGPPCSEKALYDTGDKGSSELYGVAAGLHAAATFAINGRPWNSYVGADSERTRFLATLPFDERFRLETKSDEAHRFFDATYFDKQDDWRRVDEDWLHVASDLALQLDAATNNTSLALAIERIADGKVFLFPADAQEGNWLSWHDPKMKWSVTEGHTKREVRAADLLARTVFYKVGHHASHNGTAKGKGLDLMQSPELIACIPVDRDVALGRNPKDSWQMPAFTLYGKLLEKCSGRVVRSDLGWADDAANAANKTVEKEFKGLATKAEWTKWKQEQKQAETKKAVTINHDFVDFIL
jgi:Metallo-beta-lactamase superfamily